MDSIENKIIDRFNRLYQQQKLAHFYIVETEEDPKIPDLFIENIIKSVTKTDVIDINHPDFLILAPEKDQYLIEQPSLIEYGRTWEFKPTNLNYRFFIFKDAHKIGQTILNKMLKQLEEPPTYSCIIFINSSSSTLLETIESRSIKWKLPPRQLPVWNNQGSLKDWLSCYFQFFLPEKLLEDLELNANQFAEIFFDGINGRPWELFEISKNRTQLELAMTQVTLEFFQKKNDQINEIQELFRQLQLNEDSRLLNNDHKIRIDRLLGFWQRTLFKKK